MFRHLAPDERQALADWLTALDVTPQQLAQTQEQARAIGTALTGAYSEAIGRPVAPVRFVTDVLDVEGAGRLLACALRETTGHPDLHRDI